MARFRARARTVDMLGRQQIAGAATAISELFKNAHDAYATRVEVDYYRPENLFLLRDDGIGMTLDEFEDRWLTLGTESKVGGEIPYRPPGADDRPVMGEKGIGRLAIARIGPQVLVMTRAKRGDTLNDLVVGLVNWELFELPGINLDEIEIPVETCANGTLPDSALVNRLVDHIRSVTLALKPRISQQRLDRINDNLSEFVADPQRIDGFFSRGEAVEPGQVPLSLRGEGCGTHFLIQPADSFLGEEIDRDQRADAEPTFAKFLVGFANTMVPDSPPPRVCTRFRDWTFPETASELIGGGAFLTPEDFKNADHHFSGRFDEFGQFEGAVRVYNEPPVRHVIPWAGTGRPSLCGPFTIDLAYLQGEARSSRMAPDDYTILYRKLNRFGGLYVYKDGIRVLPYGNSDFDWLNIETRRNKNLAYYFFAYRRMFGAVQITQKDNPALVEKAGRESFQLNRAYRQFTEILENFFVQLAADFFRETGIKSAIWSERRRELERDEVVRRKREESVAGRRKAFAASLENFFKVVEEDKPGREVSELFEDVQRALNAAQSDPGSDRAAALLIDTEAYAEYLLDELRKRHSVSRPRDIGLSAALRREWEGYLGEREKLEVELFLPAAERLRRTIGTAAEAANVQIDQRKRLQTLIGELAKEVEKTLQSHAADARRTAEAKQEEVRELARRALTEVKDAVDSVRAELQRIDLGGISPSAVEEIRTNLARRIDVTANRHRKALDNARRQLLEVNLHQDDQDGQIISSGEMTGAIEEEVLALRDAVDADAELVQLGMALAVVTHEFDAVIRTIREQLKRLKGWANASPQLRPIYERISGSFEHLDGYLALFTPLQRRLYRDPQRISGSEILKFLEELFSERLRRHKITLHASGEFSRHIVTGFPSTFYPVFVNIIDNAIYWLKDHRGERSILLDADINGFKIANTGPRIPARDHEAIFDLRFTRKPGGRGMGLFISRQTLAKAGFRLSLVNDEERPVCFRIAPPATTQQEEANGQK